MPAKKIKTLPSEQPGWSESAAPTRAAQVAASSQSTEDYLERIDELIEKQGYARPIEIAAALGIKQSSVTKMMQRLHDRGLANYAKHRGLTLTPAGKKMAAEVRRRHRTVSEFLRLIGVDEECLQCDTEGIEHHISPQTMKRLEAFVSYLQANPAIVENFQKPTRPLQ